ncbi:MAG TPA: prepilin-type N-terminal cleavage/methylation domain-containing protein [Solirubrobacteraceae bacterium]|nr:prepilin-type N-terminal cleavage/methylation domain-containing protein [Solirubrobacteraceae bacterium]
MHLDHRPRLRPIRRARHESGFTLIELLVVITILGILAAIVVFAVKGIGDKGKSSAVATDARVLRTAEESYCAKNGKYADIGNATTPGTLVGDRFLAGAPSYNTIKTSSGGKCGTGAGSSFAVFQNETTFVPGKDALTVGQTPVDIALDESISRAYVVNTGASPTVSVIDTDSDTVVGTPIAVGAGGTADRIAVNPTNHKVYVTNVTDNTVSIIDTQNGNSVTPVSVTTSSGGAAVVPAHLLVDPNNNDVYVIGNVTNGGIMYVDGNNAPHWISYGSGSTMVSGTTGIAIDTVADKIYLPIKISTFATELVQIDGATHSVVSCGFSNTGGVPCTTSTNNTTTGSAAVIVQTLTGQIAVDSTRHRIYMTGLQRNATPKIYRTMVIDGTQFSASNPAVSFATEASTIPSWANGIAVNPDSGTAFVLGNGPNLTLPVRVGLFNGGTATYGPTPDISNIDTNTAAAPEHVYAINPSSNRFYYAQAYIANNASSPGGLTVFDADTLLPSIIGAPRVFGAVVVNTKTNKIYATDPSGNSVAVLQ